MATFLKALAFIAGILLLNAGINYLLDTIDWLIMAIPFGSLIVGLGFIALTMWAAIKLATYLLNKIEGK